MNQTLETFDYFIDDLLLSNRTISTLELDLLVTGVIKDKEDFYLEHI
ncbi:MULTISPECIES: hypothetical protein [Prochlorococcus]|nr:MULTISPECIES: hypothetical protein [Prochlorococcus]KGG11907.1 hypothetical protein EV05_1108 [Prochlorococcus sp. MIT 0601]